jgi:microcystin-dependent protein
MPRTKAKAIFDSGIQIPSGAQTGYVLRSSDSAGNAGWQAQAVVYYEQPADPGAVGSGSIWVDTDDTPAPTNQQLVPTGTVLTTAIPVSGTPPVGFLFCDGAAISRTVYAALFTAIGTAYGVGDGTTTFNLPNLTGRVPLGTGNSGEAGGTAHTLGQKGGEEKHTLTDAEMPSHTHDLISTNVPGLTAASWGIINVVHGSGAFNNNFPYQLGGNFVNRSSTGSAGSDSPHNNLPPFLALNHMIKT